MSFVLALNFRQTLAWTTDVGESAMLGTYGGGGDELLSYPGPLDGNSLGYTTNPFSADARNRGSGANRRLAGMHSNAVGVYPAIIRIDLPTSGDYIINAAFGDGWYSAKADGIVTVLDNNTELFAIDHATGFHGGSQWRDAMDTVMDQTTWTATANGGAARTVTFSSTICRIFLGAATGSRTGWIAHFRIEQAEGAPPPPTAGGAYHQTIQRTRSWRTWR